MSSPRILVIAGHDPSHGAGLDADGAAIEFAGAQMLPVTTALTDQDERSFRSVGARPVSEWFAEAVRALERAPAALKFGLLPGRAHLRAAAELVALARARLGSGLPVVIDPVLGSSSGGRFVDDEGVQEYRAALLPLGCIWTPNLPEASELSGTDLLRLETDLDARWRWARAWVGAGAAGVVLKAGHGREDPAMDLFFSELEGPFWSAHSRIAGGKLRGSGCRYASLLAAGLAMGGGLSEAASRASGCLAEWISHSVSKPGKA